MHMPELTATPELVVDAMPELAAAGAATPELAAVDATPELAAAVAAMPEVDGDMNVAA